MIQKCVDKPKDLEELEAEVTRSLGRTLDPISAVHELDGMTYHGSVERVMLRISELIPLAYPTLQRLIVSKRYCSICKYFCLRAMNFL